MYSCWLFKCCTIIICLAVSVNSWDFGFLKQILGITDNFLDDAYYNITEIAYLFQKIETENAGIAQVHEIGKSSLGQSIFAIEITSNILKKRSLLKPMFKYVANINGDEPVGLQLLLYLAQYLVSMYGQNEQVTKLVDSTDIFLVPTLNPDGYLVSWEGECESLEDDVGRNNANGVNLNRDFPGPDKKSFDDLNNKQPETRAIINWILNNPFVLSASIRGGDLLVSYPYDKNYTNQPGGDKTSDNELFRYLAISFAKNSKIMNYAKFFLKNELKNGVANGAYRYEFEGGMQDFNYMYSNCFEVTIHLTKCKYPESRLLNSEWDDNLQAFLTYMEKVHMGIKGLIYSENNEPISGALVDVIGIYHPVKTTNRGEYWRLLLPGNYSISIKAPNYRTLYVENIIVNEGNTTIANFTLKAV